MPISRCRIVTTVLAALASGLAATPAVTASSLPRYRLEAGQRFVYEGEENVTASTSRLGLERTTEVLVVRARGEGVWDVIVTQRQARFMDRNGERTDYPERRWAIPVELHADGTVPGRSLDTFGVVNRVFPRLPRHEYELRDGWTFTGGDVHHRCRMIAGAGTEEAGPWRLEIEPTSDLTDLQKFSATWTYELDRDHGLATSIRVQHRHDGRDTRLGTERLGPMDRLDDKTVATMALEYDRFLEADRGYDRTVAETLRSGVGAAAHETLEEALRRLESVHASLKSTPLREHLVQKIEVHRVSGPGFANRIARNAALIGQAARPWSLDDLEGNRHTLEGYRGRVVILDFWYRHCGFCIRAMPQVLELARRFPSERVAVLGMNVDREESDARFVVEKFGIGYPTLRTDRNLAQAYGVRGYPTLLVIDGTGIVRSVHVGYSPTLADDVAGEVERLLPE